MTTIRIDVQDGDYPVPPSIVITPEIRDQILGDVVARLEALERAMSHKMLGEWPEALPPCSTAVEQQARDAHFHEQMRLGGRLTPQPADKPANDLAAERRALTTAQSVIIRLQGELAAMTSERDALLNQRTALLANIDTYKLSLSVEIQRANAGVADLSTMTEKRDAVKKSLSAIIESSHQLPLCIPNVRHGPAVFDETIAEYKTVKAERDALKARKVCFGVVDHGFTTADYRRGFTDAIDLAKAQIRAAGVEVE